MTSEIEVRALSNHELDSISGGQIVVCVRTAYADLFGVRFNRAECSNGMTITYVTTDHRR